MFKKYSGIFALLIATICWGPAPVFSKISLVVFPPLTFAFLGRSIALILLVILFLSKGYFKVNKKDLPLLILTGLAGAFFNVGFFVFGIRLTNAMDAQAIFSVAPVLTTIAAVFFLKEKIHPVQILGVVVGFFGALLIATREYFDIGTLRIGDMTGNFLIFLSSICFVAFILLSKKLSKKYSPQTITCYAFLVSAIAFAPLALIENLNISLSWVSDLGPMQIFGLFYIGIFASVVAFLSYQTGLHLTTAFAAGVATYIQPIITTIVAAALLNEKVTTPFVIGAFFILLGSIIATQHEIVRRNVNFNFLKQKS